MKIKNDYIKIKQGKKEVELHNLILDKYLNLYADSLSNLERKNLDSCLINCTIEETITTDMTEMHWDMFLSEQNAYDNNDFRDFNKIITKYQYEPNFKEQIQQFIGQKILSIGFAQMTVEPEMPDGSDAEFELYAILDVSNYNLYVQDMQEFVVERVDTVTTDMVFLSDTEKFPIHLSPRGNSYFDQQEETGTHEVAILNRIGKGYNPSLPTVLTPKSNFNITINENEIDITGLSIEENTEEELYPSNELYPKGKWSEEIQKSEKGSEVIIEGNNKEAFVSIEGKSEQETGKSKNLFDYKQIISRPVMSIENGGFVINDIYFQNGYSIGILKNLCPDLKVGDKFKFNWDTNATRNNTDVTYIYLNSYADTVRKDITYTCTQEMLDSDTYFYGQQGQYYKNIMFYLDGQTSDYEPYGEKPSPSIPSEIHSVADDVNLLDITDKTRTISGASYLSKNGEIIINGQSLSNSSIDAGSIFLEANKNYTCSLSNNGTLNGSYFAINDNGTYIFLGENNRTFTVSQTKMYTVLFILISGNYNNLKISPKIQKGTEATPYSPYNQGTVTIKQRGKNNYNTVDRSQTRYGITCSSVNNKVTINGTAERNNFSGTYFNINGTDNANANYYDFDSTTDGLTLPAGTYTLSLNNITGSYSTTQDVYIRINKVYSGATPTTTLASILLTNNENSVTFTLSEQTKIKVRTQIRIPSDTSIAVPVFNNYSFDIQIEKGSKTTYEPYQTPHDYTFQTEPLRSLPNGVKDTIEDDGIHRRVGRVVLDGTENWTQNSTYQNVYLIDNFLTDADTTETRPMLSDYFQYGGLITQGSSTVEIGKFYQWTSLPQRLILGYNSTSLNDFKVWLSNNLVTILYPLAEEIIEPFTEEQMEVLGSIQTFEGYNNFTTTDDLQPIIQVTEYENCIYPRTAQMPWVFYEFSVYKFIDTVTGYQDTGRTYCEAKNTDNSGNLNLKIKYERG